MGLNVKLGLTLFILSPAVSAQQPTLRTESNLVIVPTLVKGDHGKPVFGLQANDFLVQDDGVEQKIHLDDAADPEPVSLVIAVQTGRTAEAEFRRIRTLVTMLDPILSAGQTEVALLSFDSQVTIVQDFTLESGLIERDLKKLERGDNGAAILDAINLAAHLLEKRPKGRQRVLLLVSETRDHGSHAVTIDDVLASLGTSNTLVFSMAFSPTVSNLLDDTRGNLQPEGDWVNLGQLATKLLIMARQAMRKNIPKAVAEMTGGEYEFFKSHHGFESRMTE
ncbi:MAG TPA: VWA domain-containing protein, partial [Terriglobales bacterium]|nr:VWA domain-containing protein [Terriglobales bacterium]